MHKAVTCGKTNNRPATLSLGPRLLSHVQSGKPRSVRLILVDTLERRLASFGWEGREKNERFTSGNENFHLLLIGAVTIDSR